MFMTVGTKLGKLGPSLKASKRLKPRQQKAVGRNKHVVKPEARGIA